MTNAPETAPEIRGGFPQVRPVEDAPPGLGQLVDGVPIPARSAIGVCMGSANRDARRWERSEEFDIFRKYLPHISFAAGEHTCLGLHLARLETRVALDCLLSRLTNVKLVADGDPHIHGQPFRSPTALPVTFDAN